MQNKKITFVGILAQMSGLLTHLIKQWKLFAIYSVIITIWSALFGRWSFSCQRDNTGPWCYVPTERLDLMVAFLVVFYIILFFLISSCAADFQNAMAKNSVFKWRDLLNINKRKLKSIAFILGIFAGFILPIMISMAIINKPANPDFRIEFIYFTIMFVMFLIPLVLIRFSAGIAYFLNDGNIPVRKIYAATEGKSYIQLLCFLFLIITTLSLNIRLMGYFNLLTGEYQNIVTVVLTDFADSFIKLVYMAAFLIFFQAQYQQLEKLAAASEIPEEGNTAADEIITQSTRRNNKTANKKKNKRKNLSASPDRLKSERKKRV